MFVAEAFTGTPGAVRQARRHGARLPEILDGKHDDLPEQAFYMVGNIEASRAKGRQDGASLAPRAGRVVRNA